MVNLQSLMMFNNGLNWNLILSFVKIKLLFEITCSSVYWLQVVLVWPMEVSAKSKRYVVLFVVYISFIFCLFGFLWVSLSEKKSFAVPCQVFCTEKSGAPCGKEWSGIKDILDLEWDRTVDDRGVCVVLYQHASIEHVKVI
jgi:hypothetical protein